MTDEQRMFQDENQIETTINELSSRLILEKTKLNMLNDQQKKQSKLVTALEERVYEKMLEYGMDKIGIGGITLSPQKQIWASIKAGDHAGVEWLKRHGIMELTSLTVNSKKLSSVVREMINNGNIIEGTDTEGKAAYFDNQGRIDGVNISFKRKILVRGLKDKSNECE